MINYYSIPLAPDASQRHLCLKDFERADVRVAERRFEQGTSSTPPAIPMASFISLEGTVRLQDLRRLQGSHGCAVDAGRCLRRAEFPGDIPPECLRRGGHRISGSCAKSVLNEVIKRHPMFALKLFFLFGAP